MPYDNEKGVPRAKKNSYNVRPNYRSVSDCRWSSIPSELVTELVRVVTDSGAAIMFGLTSDRGALSLCILAGEEKLKEYPRDETEVQNLLLWLKDEYFPTPLSTKK